MASAMLCDACKRFDNDDQQVADFWCGACAENLCAVCTVAHRKLKFTSHHFVLPLQDKEKMSNDILEQSVTCSDHPNRQFKFFCTTDKEVICELCRIKHRQCPGLTEIENAVKEDFIDRFKDRVARLHKTLSTLLQERNEKKHLYDTEKNDIAKEIKNFRQVINDKIDTLEREIMQSLTTKHEKRISEIESSRQKLSNMQSKLKSTEQDVDIVKRHVTNEQLFIIFSFLGKNIQRQLDELGNISRSDETIQLNWKKANFLHLITKLGTIFSQSSSADAIQRDNSGEPHSNEDEGESEQDVSTHISDTESDRNTESNSDDVEYSSNDETHSSIGCSKLNARNHARTSDCQRNTRNRSTTAEPEMIIDSKRQKTFHLKTKFYITSMVRKINSCIPKLAINPYVDRCSFWHKNKIVLADTKNGCIFLCEQSGNSPEFIQCNVKDVEYSVNGGLYISIDQEGVHELNCENNSLRKVLSAEKCLGISSFKGKLVVLVGKKTINIVDFKSKVQTKVSVSVPPSHLCCDNDGNLFQTSKTNDAVMSYDFDGTTRFKFTNSDLVNAQGIATDDDGQVYVCGYDSNNILKISHDGKSHVVVLSKENGINQPFVCDFNKTTQELMILNEDHSSVEIYQM